MISCDKCLEWFHGTCVGVTRKQGKNIAKKHDKWSCPSCLAGEFLFKFNNNNMHSTSLVYLLWKYLLVMCMCKLVSLF